MLLRHYAEEQKKMLVDLQLRLDEAKIQTESGYLYLNREWIFEQIVVLNGILQVVGLVYTRMTKLLYSIERFRSC
jgi:hypothetical protein